MQCIDDPTKSMKEIEDAVANFETNDMMHLTLGMQQLALSLYSIVNAVKECDEQVRDEELEIITNMLKQFKNPKEVAYKVGQNLMVNGVDIYKELSAAYTSYYAKEYEAFGKDVGIAVALTFIGSVQPKGDVRNSMMGSAKNQLFPDKDQVLDEDDVHSYQSKLAKVNDLWKLRQAEESEEINQIARDHKATHDIIAENPTFDEDGDAFYDAQETEDLQNLVIAQLEDNKYYLY